MKIALVAPYDFAHPGGVTNHISALDYEYTQLGHDVRIIAPASRHVTDFGDRFIPIGRIKKGSGTVSLIDRYGKSRGLKPKGFSHFQGE